VDSAAARQAGVVFEAMLLQMTLAPLARSDAAFGRLGMAYVAQSVAEHDARGFGAAIAAVLERRHA
jgi:hypothetical protein